MKKLGTRKFERIRFILGRGEEEKVSALAFFKRTGYVPTDTHPVHQLYLEHLGPITIEGVTYKRDSKKKPLDLVEGLAILTAERPLKKSVSHSR